MKAIRVFVDRRRIKPSKKSVSSPAEQKWENLVNPAYDPRTSVTIQTLEAKLKQYDSY